MTPWGNKLDYQSKFDKMSEQDQESLEERAAIIEFCSGDAMMSRKRAERLAMEQYLNKKFMNKN